jgi:toxin ParE1/3/4
VTYELSLAPAARADIIDALDWSGKNFGDLVREGYEALIIAALDLIRSDPAVLGSHERVVQVVRLLHDAMNLPEHFD